MSDLERDDIENAAMTLQDIVYGPNVGHELDTVLDLLDATSNEELREKLNELNKLSKRHKETGKEETWHHGFGCGLGRAINEIEEMIDSDE